MPDYQKGKIYKIISPSKNLIYYGSTTQTLPQRLAQHIKENKAYNNKVNTRYCCSYLVIECEDYKIELVEEYPCNNKQQLNKKEGEYQKSNECVNTHIAGRTTNEYYQDNKKQIYENRKEATIQWARDNKEKRAATYKKYYENNRQRILEKKRQQNAYKNA